jgi:leader peptidase (prepilin peptidase) / N-methyltransferase
MPHLIFIPFLFAVGACVGSFLNVVVWRLPRIEVEPDASTFRALMRTIEGLSNPPSHCPKCDTPIRWYDNLPVIGWIKLRGKCRECGQPISIRYPTIEFITGALFVFYYVMFFIVQIGPCAPVPRMVPHETLGSMKMIVQPLLFTHDWRMYALMMAMVSALLAASLIDAELFMIPIEIPWVMAALGLIVHTIIDKPSMPGALSATPTAGALAAGGTVGLIITLVLWFYEIIPQSFAEGEPMQDVHELPDEKPVVASGWFARLLNWFRGAPTPAQAARWAAVEAKAKRKEPAVERPPEPAIEPPTPMSRRDLNRELRKEMAFLLAPMLLAAAFYFVVTRIAPIGQWWGDAVAGHPWFSGLLGSLLGALVGGFVVWVTRILGTLAFGRLAMGLGDVHLMFGVGAIIGAGCATIAFFLAPFFGIGLALYMFVSGTKRELPYGPYLSLATMFVLLFCCPIKAYLAPGLEGLTLMVRQVMGS